MKVVRAIVGLLAVVFIIVGAGVAVALGPDDTWEGGSAALPAGEPVVSTAPELLNVAGVDLVVTAALDEGEVFIGASHPVHVEDFLRDVQRARITTLGAGGIAGTDVVEGERGYPSVSPAKLDVWTERVSGEGEQHVSVPLTEDAAVEIVVMPAVEAEAEPVVGIGYALPGAFVGAVVVALVGVLLLVAVVLSWGRHHGPEGSDASVQHQEPAGAQPTSGPTVRRVVAVVAVVGLATGCSIPRQVDHAEMAGLVPLTDADAQTVLDDYDKRNNAAIKKSHHGDGSLWATADTGPLLAVDEVSARTADVEGGKGDPSVGVHEAGRVYEVEQHAYPLWGLLVTESSWDGQEANGPSLDLFIKKHATGAWKGGAGVPVTQGDLPTALSADEATPDAADLDRAGEVDLLLQTWLEKGKASGLDVTEDLVSTRKQLATKDKGVDEIQMSADTWGVADDPTGPGGAVHVVRVEDGLLLLTSQEWEVRNYLKPGFKWVQSKEGAAIYGTQHRNNVNVAKYVVMAAVLVPDSGAADVLGSSVRRVVDFPRG